MSEKQSILTALHGLADAFNNHDVDQVMSYFAADCTLDMPRGSEPYGTRYLGFDEVRRGLLSRFESTPDVHYGELEHFVSGHCGISKWLLSGTKLDGQRINVRGCDFYMFRDGKVIGKDSYWKIVE